MWMDEGSLQEFVVSICVQGVMQLILVWFILLDKYEIIVGEWCFCVVCLVGFDEVLVFVKDVFDQVVVVMVLIENIQCEDLNLFEEVYGIQCLFDEFGFMYEQVVELVGCLCSVVLNLLCLLNFVLFVQMMLLVGDFDMGYVCVLFVVDVVMQIMFVYQVVNKCMLVCEIEKFVVYMMKEVLVVKVCVKDDGGCDICCFEEELLDLFVLMVKIKLGCCGCGQVLIDFGNFDVFEGIFVCLCGNVVIEE